MRGRGGSGTGVQMVVLLMMLAALVMLLVTKQRCARAVGGYFETLEREAPPAPSPGGGAR